MPDPLDAHFPSRFTISPEIVSGIKASMPPLNPDIRSGAMFEESFEDFAVETLEWLSLVALQSPRIDPKDKIDQYLSRYVPPGDATTRSKLVKITWQGFIPPSWAHKTFVKALLAVPQDAWLSMCVVGFSEGYTGGCGDSTILKVPNASNEYILWETSR